MKIAIYEYLIHIMLFYPDCEKRLGIAEGTVARTVMSGSESGAWARMERGEIQIDEFSKLFSAECSKVVRFL